MTFTIRQTEKPLVYACEQMTQKIVDVPESESERLLEELFAVMYSPAHQIEHHWRTGDFVVWDNLSVQHGRPNVTAEGPTAANSPQGRRAGSRSDEIRDPDLCQGLMTVSSAHTMA